MTEMTPDMVELVLPMLGFSILLNFLFLGMLLFRPLYRSIINKLEPYWIGLQLLREGDDSRKVNEQA